jgi:hypothetical protein
VRVTCDDCDFDLVSREGDLTIWSVHVPIDARPLRVITQNLDEISPGSNAQLTFERDRLKSFLSF